jgi:WD40 repeat protein
VTRTTEPTRRAQLPDCPYVGLRNFTEDYADFFFGRDEDRKRIIGNLRVARLTLLYAESGVGKSSVLRAGVMARLRELAEADGSDGGVSREVPVLFSSWSEDPIRGLIDEVVAATSPFATEPLTVSRDCLADALLAATEAIAGEVLVILDQFEEYFANPSRQGPGDPFADQLAECINHPDLGARFLISIREDAYASLGDLLNSRVDNVYGNYLHLDYLDESAARDSVVKPVERWNELIEDGEPYEVEPSLVDAIVSQVRLGEVAQSGIVARSEGSAFGEIDTRVETTYLQLVMKRLWDEEVRAGSHTLRLETLRRLGDAEHIIGTHLDTAMAKLSAEQQDAAAALFRFLVTRTGMKIAISASDLADMSNVPEAELEGTLRRLAAADLHILRSVAVADDHDGPRYEIFHDALAQPIREWRNRHLLTKAQEEQRAELARRGAQLAEARSQAGRERRRRVVLSAVSVVLVALLIATFTLWRRSQDLSNRSESAALAAQALSAGSNPERSLDLAQQAVDRARTPEALLAARSAIAKPYVKAVFTQDIGDPTTAQVAQSPDGHVVAFGGSGGAWIWDRRRNTTRELVASDGTRFGSTTNLGQPVAFRFSAHNSRLLAIGTLSALTYDYQQVDPQARDRLGPIPDAGIMATGSDFVGGAISADGGEVVVLRRNEQDVSVVDLSNHPVRPPENLGSSVVAADWSDDGRTLVTLTDDRTLTVWNDDGTALTQRGTPLTGVSTYRFSPAGTSLATGTTGAVNLWSLPDMAPMAPPLETSTGDPVQEIAFHREFRLAVGFHGDVSIFDSKHPGKRPAVLVTGRQFRPGSGPVNDVALADLPLVMTNNSGSISIWDSEVGVPIEKYDFSGRLFDPQLHSNGTYDFLQLSRVPRSGTDPTLVGRMRLWTGRTGWSLGELKGGVSQTSFSRDNTHLIDVFNNPSPNVPWRVEVRTYPGLLPGPPVYPYLAVTSDISSAIIAAVDKNANELVTVVSPNVSTSISNRIQVWDPASGDERTELQDHFPHGYPAAMDVTPDGRSVLIAGIDFSQNLGYTERIPVDGGPAKVIDQRRGNGDTALAVSDDDRYYVVGTDDGTAVVIGSNNLSRKMLRPRGNGSAAQAMISAVAISQTSRLIATGNSDGTVVLWDRASGTILRQFELGSEIRALTFTPNADYLIAKGSNTPTQVLATSGDTGANAVMLVDPVPEPTYQAAVFDPQRRRPPYILSTEGRYAVVYPCTACVSETDLLKEMNQRLNVEQIQN